MGTIKWRFLQNGSLNNFDFWQICFIIDQIVIPMGSGQLFLIDGPTVIVARRAQLSHVVLCPMLALKADPMDAIMLATSLLIADSVGKSYKLKYSLPVFAVP